MAEKEYIPREAAIDCLIEILDRPHHAEFLYTDEICGTLKSIPAADVRPVVRAAWKHVQWVIDDDEQEGGYWISRCSNCSMPYHTETPFCPHCGADMREESRWTN